MTRLWMKAGLKAPTDRANAAKCLSPDLVEQLQELTELEDVEVIGEGFVIQQEYNLN